MNSLDYTQKAVADIRGNGNAPRLFGTVKFYEMKDFVLIEAIIDGLPPSKSGFFGFHIHEGESCGGIDFAETGGHYNPQGLAHPAHAGDLPPLILCDGGAFIAFATDRFKLKDIIGKTVVIHSNPDDFTTQPAGNAGTKIACGVIKSI